MNKLEKEQKFILREGKIYTCKYIQICTIPYILPPSFLEDLSENAAGNVANLYEHWR